MILIILQFCFSITREEILKQIHNEIEQLKTCSDLNFNFIVSSFQKNGYEKIGNSVELLCSDENEVTSEKLSLFLKLIFTSSFAEDHMEDFFINDLCCETEENFYFVSTEYDLAQKKHFLKFSKTNPSPNASEVLFFEIGFQSDQGTTILFKFYLVVEIPLTFKPSPTPFLLKFFGLLKFFQGFYFVLIPIIISIMAQYLSGVMLYNF